VARWSINQASSLSWDFDRDLREYLELGAAAISVMSTKLDAFGREAGRKLLRDSGMRLAAYGSIGSFDLHDRARWPAQIARARDEIAFGADLGAPLILMLTGAGQPHPYAASETALLAILQQILPAAERCDVTLAFEHNHALRVDLGFIHSLHDALDLAQHVGSPHFKVCVEMNNAWIERHLEQDIRERTRWIGLVQVNDFAAGTLATPDRVPLGDGMIPLRRIIGQLEQAGYRGDYDIELVGPRIEALGYAESIRRSIAYLEGLQDEGMIGERDLG
jgi:sugar phosphate isomerase/epimerase